VLDFFFLFGRQPFFGGGGGAQTGAGEYRGTCSKSKSPRPVGAAPTLPLCQTRASSSIHCKCGSDLNQRNPPRLARPGQL